VKSNKAIGIILGAAVGVGGCAPSVYHDWADSQVQDILKDRKKQTLGYEPEVKAKTTVPDEPSRAAYEKIPTTPIPPLAVSPLEPSRVTIPYGELGPELPKEGVGNAAHEMPNPYDQTAMRGRTFDRLQLGPPTPGGMGTQLDLFRSIEYAVQHSRSYESTMEDVYLQTLDVTLQRHLFEPTPFVTQAFNYTGGQRDVAFRSALTAVTTAGVKQKLPYGGEIQAQALTTTVQTIDGHLADGQSAGVALTGSIPLLRGAGMVNLESLISSERQLVYEIRTFETFRRDFAVQIATQYFNLISQQQALANTRSNYAGLARLTLQTQANYQAGRQNFLDVQRSAQAQLQSESTIISSEDSFQSALDQFKIALGMPIDTELEIVPVELDLNVPVAESTRAIELATQYRLDLQTLRDQIEDARRGVSIAKNGLLPDVNLTGSYNAGNRPIDPLFGYDARSQVYAAGVSIELPVDRLAERNVYRTSLITLQRAQRNYEQQRDTIAVAARDALRGIASAQTNLEIQRMGIEMAQKRLDNAREVLQAGITINGVGSSTLDAVDAQQDLLTAQDSYAQARASLQISVLNYLRETGTLRVDPSAGALGKALDRGALKLENKVPIEQ
jgi:outer membrane protein TolC